MPPKNQSVRMKQDGFDLYHRQAGYEKEIYLHHHDCYEVYLFLSGSVHYAIEGKRFQLRAGDCMAISPGILHEPIFMENESAQNNYNRYILHISPHCLQIIDSSALQLKALFRHEPIHIKSDILSVLQLLFEQLHEQEYLQGFGATELKQTYIKQILIFLNRCIQNADLEKYEKYSASHPVLDQALVYIGEHLTDVITIEQLAKQFSMNPYSFLREFKKYIGITPYHYILKKRLIAAEQLLTEGYPVKEVYQKCGFTDYSNFFRAFKQEYGQTPKQYFESHVYLK